MMDSQRNHLLFLSLVCFAIIYLVAANVEFIARKHEYFNSAPIRVGTLSEIGCCTSCGYEENCLAANYNQESSVCELLAQKPQVREDFVKRQNRTLFIKSDVSDDSWFQFNQNIYILVAKRMDWRHADAYCMTLNAELVDIHSIEEQAFVFNISEGNALLWIGLTDIAIEDVFEWTTEKSLTYTEWYDGEPNDAYEGEDCVCMWFSAGGKWLDISCYSVEISVCKKTLH